MTDITADPNSFFEGMRAQALKGGSKDFLRTKEALRETLGEAAASSVAEDGEARYRQILSELPPIPEEGQYCANILLGACFSLALYLALKAKGWSDEQIGRFQYESLEEATKAGDTAPMGPTGTSPERDREILTRMAEWTQRRECPGVWLTRMVDVTGTEYDYGFDDFECGILKLFEQHGAREFVPYMCLIDQLTYPPRGRGLTRTKTLAGGDDRCDFRVRVGGDMHLLEPFSAQKLREWGKVREE
jgi:hypothetical protein